MTVLNSIIDNLGDFFGTSKLAQLNKTVFRPTIGTDISRQEYDMCGGTNIWRVPDKNEAATIRHLKDGKRRKMGNDLLEKMVENGTIFSDAHIFKFASTQQKELGSTELTNKVLKQMSRHGEDSLKVKHNRQQYQRWIPQGPIV